MIIQTLHEYAVRNNLDPNYETKTIGYVFEILPDGTLVRAVTENKVARVPRLDNRGNRISPKFFIDTSPYLTGLGDQDPERRVKCKAAGIEFVSRVVQETGDEGARAVEAFLHRPVSDAIKALGLKGTEWCTLRMVGSSEYIFDRPKLRDIWIKQNQEMLGATDRCRITNEVVCTAKCHPKISMPDSKGAMLVSYNLDVSEFEGREQGANWPTGIEVAQRYGAAMKHMLERNEDGRYRSAVFIKAKKSVMGTIFAYTLDGRAMTPLLDILDAPFIKDEKERSAHVDRTWGALSVWRDEKEPVNILVLKSNQSRIMVLDFFQRPLGEIVRNLEAFRSDFLEVREVTVHSLIRPLARLDGSISPLALPIFRSALLGTPYPEPLLQSKSAAWRRAVQRRNHHKEKIPMAYNPDHPDWRYQLGCLSAITKQLHAKAFWKTQATLGRLIEETAKNPRRGLVKLRRKAALYLDTLERKGQAGTWKKAYLSVSERLVDVPSKRLDDEGECLYWAGHTDQSAEISRWIQNVAEKKNAEREEAIKAVMAKKNDAPSSEDVTTVKKAS